MITIYVACSSKKLDIARKAISKFKDSGFEIIYNWPEEFEKEVEYQDDLELLSINATKCIRAAKNADVTVYMATEKLSLGSMVEIGCAMGSGKFTVVCEEFGKFNHFFRNLKDLYVYSSLDDVISLLYCVQSEADELVDSLFTDPLF